ncbi:MAG: S9 family peptidase [Clostridia bacterium]|nr:S9 family peptidase [Clostridia bacterium]
MIGIRDFLNYTSLSGLSVSPDGRQAVFSVTRPVLESNGYSRELHLCSLESGKSRRLLADGDFCGECVWLDSGTIGYPAVNPEGGTDWREHCVESGEIRTLCRLPEGVRSAWPLAQGGCAYLKSECLRESDYPADLSFLKDWEDGFEILDEIPAYFNGEGFVSGRRSVLYAVDSAGCTVRITARQSNVDRVLPRPEGLYWAARTYRGVNTEPGIYYLPNGKSEPVLLVPEGRYRIHAWTVEAEGCVLFAAHDKQVHIMSDDALFYRACEGSVERLDLPEASVGDSTCHDTVYGESSGFEARDGAVYYIATREHDSVVMRAVPGKGAAQMTPGGRSVTGFRLLPDGGLLAVAMGPDTLEELWRCENGGAVRLTRFSDERLRKEDVLPAEKFTFRNHGFNVNYLVLKPADFDSSRRYPAIFYIHGGAKVCYTDVFFHEMQVLASRGYFVIYGNPRGSDGQGSEFARLLGHYGEPDYEDIMMATDEALRLYPNIDPGRLGVTGGSYGGIMVNWVITHTDRFRAAVAQRSICSMVSTFGTADNGYNFVREQMGGDLWNAFDDLWRQSPLKYANRCRTPLLLIHSDEDYRCHYTEAMQMFTALKYLGVETQVCLIHGENHSLSRCGRPVQRIRRLYEIIRWFDAHLSEAKE